MNKKDVVQKVAARSGVDPETCEKVIDSLEKILQEELSSKGATGVLQKIAAFLTYLSSSSSSR